jgi:hypothetical protein
MSGMAEFLELFGRLVLAEGRAAPCVLLYGAADAERKKIHMPLSPIERQERQMQLDMAEKALGSALYSKKWDEGYRMASKQAMDLATATLV